MFSLTPQYENPVQATAALLKELKVKVNASAVNEALQNHPDYPSMLSISDGLKTWKIENMAVKVEKEKLDELPFPFIAHTKENGGSFIPVKRFADDKVECGIYSRGDAFDRRNSIFE